MRTVILTAFVGACLWMGWNLIGAVAEDASAFPAAPKPPRTVVTTPPPEDVERESKRISRELFRGAADDAKSSSGAVEPGAGAQPLSPQETFAQNDVHLLTGLSNAEVAAIVSASPMRERFVADVAMIMQPLRRTGEAKAASANLVAAKFFDAGKADSTRIGAENKPDARPVVEFEYQDVLQRITSLGDGQVKEETLRIRPGMSAEYDRAFGEFSNAVAAAGDELRRLLNSMKSER